MRNILFNQQLIKCRIKYKLKIIYLKSLFCILYLLPSLKPMVSKELLSFEATKTPLYFIQHIHNKFFSYFLLSAFYKDYCSFLTTLSSAFRCFSSISLAAIVHWIMLMNIFSWFWHGWKNCSSNLLLF